MIIELKQRTIIFVREKVYSGTSVVSHMVAGGIKPGKSTVFLLLYYEVRNEFTQSNRRSNDR